MKIDIGTMFGIIGTLSAIVFGYIAYSRNKANDTKIETKEDTRDKVQLNAKLDVLLSNNTEIKGSVKELDKKLDNFKDDVNIRLTRVEESCKQAHKRLDTFEKGK